MNLDGIPDKTTAKICEVLAHFSAVEKAILFGSRAKGTAKPGSDIDLTLVGHDLNQRILGEIDNELDDLYLPYNFDLSLFSEIQNPDLLNHIARVGLIFYQRSPTEALAQSATNGSSK